MNARDDILDLVVKILPPEHGKAYRETFDRKLDAFAHELAGKVIDLRDTIPNLKASDAWKRGYDAALLVVASMLNPEAH